MYNLTDVVGYEEFFSITENGEVWSKRTKRFLKYVVHPTGYKVFCTRFGGRSSTPVLFRIHRLVAMTFINNPEDKPFVNHKDGNKTNNHVSNLEWVTPKENTAHAMLTGLMKHTSGYDNKNSIFNPETIENIRSDYASGLYTHRSLGYKYGVVHTTIGRITRNVRYI